MLNVSIFLCYVDWHLRESPCVSIYVLFLLRKIKLTKITIFPYSNINKIKIYNKHLLSRDHWFYGKVIWNVLSTVRYSERTRRKAYHVNRIIAIDNLGNLSGNLIGMVSILGDTVSLNSLHIHYLLPYLPTYLSSYDWLIF